MITSAWDEPHSLFSPTTQYAGDIPSTHSKKTWSATEQVFLRESYGRLTYREIARVLGRSVLEVKYRAKVMGLLHPERYSANNVRDNQYMEQVRKELYG